MNKRFGFITAGLLLLLASIANGALAAEAMPWAMPASESAVNDVLSPIFGGILGGNASGSSPVASLFGNLNAALLILGGILGAYGILAGTAQTAHDGEVLGKRWSSLWVPIRLALGMAMIVPTGNGYCGAQMFVAWIGQQGVAVAAGTWATFAKSELMPAPGDYRPTIIPGVRSLALGLLNSSVCALAYDHYMHLDESTAGGLDDGKVVITEIEPGKFSYGTAQVGTGFCGGFTVQKTLMETDPTGVGQAHGPAFQNLAARMQTLALKISDLNQPIDQATTNAEITAAVAEYEQAIAIAATVAVAMANVQRKEAAHNGSMGGWIMTGAYYNASRKAVNAVSAGIGAVPKPTALNLAGASPDVSAHVSTMMSRADGASSGANDFFKGPSLWDRAKGMASGALDTGARILSGDIGPGMLMSYVSQSFSTFAQAFADVRNAKGDALDNLRHLGEAAMAASIVGFGLAVVLGIISTTGGLVLAGLSATLFSFGVANGLYLPMLPTILWMAAVISWFTLFVECMIAAPIWALMHVHLEGDGIAGRGGNGYEIILGLFLRPILMTIGFSIAMASATPLIKIWNTMFYAGVASNFDDPNSILLQIAMFCVYTAVTVAIVHKLFALIHIVPDRIMRWIGGGVDSLGGNAAEHIGRQSHAGATAAVGAATGSMPLMARHGGGSGRAKGNSDKPGGGDTPIVNQRESPKGGMAMGQFNADPDMVMKDRQSDVGGESLTNSNPSNADGRA